MTLIMKQSIFVKCRWVGANKEKLLDLNFNWKAEIGLRSHSTMRNLFKAVFWHNSKWHPWALLWNLKYKALTNIFSKSPKDVSMLSWERSFHNIEVGSLFALCLYTSDIDVVLGYTGFYNRRICTKEDTIYNSKSNNMNQLTISYLHNTITSCQWYSNQWLAKYSSYNTTCKRSEN